MEWVAFSLSNACMHAKSVQSYDGDFRLPLVLGQGSPIIHSSCEGQLGVALASLQGKGDLI